MTAQNHGFAVDLWSLTDADLRRWRLRASPARTCSRTGSRLRFGGVRPTHQNLNDGTLEGMALDDHPAFSVQYHPEAAPGPRDAHRCSTTS